MYNFEKSLKTCSGTFHGPLSPLYRDGHLDGSHFPWDFANIDRYLNLHTFEYFIDFHWTKIPFHYIHNHKRHNKYQKWKFINVNRSSINDIVIDKKEHFCDRAAVFDDIVPGKSTRWRISNQAKILLWYCLPVKHFWNQILSTQIFP